MPQTKKEKISTQAKALVEAIREYSRSQKKLWQKLPYLALEADGRTGYLGTYAKAYRLGYWEVQCSVNRGDYNMYVDVETGEFISPWDYQKEVPDEYVLRLALRPQEINVEQIIEELRQKAQRPTSSVYNSHKQARWRGRLRRELGLGKVYSRIETIKAEPHRGWIEDMVAGWDPDPIGNFFD